MRLSRAPYLPTITPAHHSFLKSWWALCLIVSCSWRVWECCEQFLSQGTRHWCCCNHAGASAHRQLLPPPLLLSRLLKCLLMDERLRLMQVILCFRFGAGLLVHSLS